ncbi:MAG TPA: site-2 protease family protein, partial [Candidatus Pacearchaeota archaeon]|nr:site-2 protease family protein [Candidatus Pacearchaeota archaeon]
MSFLAYDIGFLVLFAITVGILLYKNRKHVKKEGLMLLYKTNWGIRLIEHIGKKYKKLLDVLSYISVTVGYLLMAGIIYLFGRLVWIYIFHADVVRQIKVPPIMPLVPYIPQMFKLDYLPPFYFTYWILIIAVIAITHEFAHGIFAARVKVKIKNTGFGFFPFFLPVFLAAFVEPDEKEMAKKKPFDQMTILSAGTFANILTSIFFLLVLWGFFFLAFAPSGIVFNTYAQTIVNASMISSIGETDLGLLDYDYNKLLELSNKSAGISEIKVLNKTYVVSYDLLLAQKENEGLIVVYQDSPAIRTDLESVIFKINNIKVDSYEKLAEELLNYSPGDKVTLTVLGDDNKPYNKDIILGKNPENETLAWIGVGFLDYESETFLQKMYQATSFRKPYLYYSPRLGEFSIFVYNLIWWIIIVSLSAALMNMLPAGLFDGGRFFYLTILAITKKEKTAKRSFAFLTYLFLALLVIIMFFWVIAFR